MKAEKKLEDGVLTLKVEGRLDTNTSPDLEAIVSLDGVKEVIVDFAGLEYISSAGLRILMAIRKEMAACDGKMTIVSPNEMVKGILDMTGMSSYFTFA